MVPAVDEVTVLDAGYDPVMTPRGVLIALLVVMFVTTLVDMGAGLSARGEPVLWSLLTGLLSNFLMFYWFRVDRELRAWPRSRWLSTAMVTITPLAVPYYLARSRPRGKKLRGVAEFVGFVVLMIVASILGGMLALLLA
ncbi:hypothetical protein [Massilia sp.]|uniref:hypothetical protein n=1 Tax=Massilia sp. TaxID=1882437 RepID=UPI0028ADEC9A|nr:hypothetical protein [Massilia sp.]